MIKIPSPWIEDPEAFEVSHGLSVVDILTVIEEMGPEISARVERLAKVDADAAAAWAIAEAVKRGLLVDQEKQAPAMPRELEAERGA